MTDVSFLTGFLPFFLTLRTATGVSHTHRPASAAQYLYCVMYCGADTNRLTAQVAAALDMTVMLDHTAFVLGRQRTKQ